MSSLPTLSTWITTTYDGQTNSKPNKRTNCNFSTSVATMRHTAMQQISCSSHKVYYWSFPSPPLNLITWITLIHTAKVVMEAVQKKPFCVFIEKLSPGPIHTPNTMCVASVSAPSDNIIRAHYVSPPKSPEKAMYKEVTKMSSSSSTSAEPIVTVRAI